MKAIFAVDHNNYTYFWKQRKYLHGENSIHLHSNIPFTTNFPIQQSTLAFENEKKNILFLIKPCDADAESRFYIKEKTTKNLLVESHNYET